jgi:teichuronic acid biosynthesis glycosyltransferase TuaG
VHYICLMRESVGVVIPTYNRPSETLRAVNSVLDQTYPVQQIIVVDDGSSHESNQELSKIMKKLPIQLISTSASKHPGLARNVGIEQITTSWVAFLDSDDWWTKEKIQVQLEAAREFRAKAVCSNAKIISSSGSKEFSTNYKSGFLLRKQLIKRNQIVNSSVLLETDLLKKIGCVESRYSMRGAEDYVTWLMISDNSNWYLCGDDLVNYQEDSYDSIRTNYAEPEIDSHIQGLIGYIERKNKNKLRKRIIRRVLKDMASI